MTAKPVRWYIASSNGPEPSRRQQVYSNRPLAVYGYIVPQGDGLFGVQVGDGFTPVDAPLSAHDFPSRAAAMRWLREQYEGVSE
jgi:hypothetical protein